MRAEKSKSNCKKYKKALLIIAVCLIALTLFVIINNYCLSTTYEVFTTEKVKDDIRIILISDLHGKYFGSENSVLGKAIEKKNPDMVVIAGDVVSSDGDVKAAVSLIERIASFCDSIYYSNGNHEHKKGNDAGEIEKQLEKAGATVLNNKSVIFTKGESSVKIYGVDLPMYFYTGYNKGGNLEYELGTGTMNALVGEKSDMLNILIAHNPCYFEAYAAWGADIVLSGHNHGGAIRLFGKGLVSPNGDIKNKHYDCGVYSSKTQNTNSKMFLSRGLGEWAGPVRIFNLPEIFVIDIKNNA